MCLKSILFGWINFLKKKKVIIFQNLEPWVKNISCSQIFSFSWCDKNKKHFLSSLKFTLCNVFLFFIFIVLVNENVKLRMIPREMKNRLTFLFFCCCFVRKMKSFFFLHFLLSNEFVRLNANRKKTKKKLRINADHNRTVIFSIPSFLRRSLWKKKTTK